MGWKACFPYFQKHDAKAELEWQFKFNPNFQSLSNAVWGSDDLRNITIIWDQKKARKNRFVDTTESGNSIQDLLHS